MQAHSQGGSLGAKEPPFLNRRSISLLKRSTFCLKSYNFTKNVPLKGPQFCRKGPLFCPKEPPSIEVSGRVGFAEGRG